MKIHITIFTLLTTIIINSQTPIIGLENWDGEVIENAYYKDINNVFDPFLGTWLYTNGTTSFKIVLTKKVMKEFGGYYSDYIIGEYEYKENNTILRSTLNNTDEYNAGIVGDDIINSNNYPLCLNCTVNEKRLKLSLRDRVRHLSGDLTLKLTSVNGVPALEGLIYEHGNYYYDIDNPPTYNDMITPAGTFIFIKE